MAGRMASAIAKRMANLVRFGWQNDAPNPNPNPNPTFCPSAVDLFFLGFTSNSKLQSVTREAFGLGAEL